MHSELYEVSPAVASRLNQYRTENKRIIAVGTTVTRTLETVFSKNQFHANSSDTNIYIYPGYKFKAINGLLTNFHLPKSTLLMLVSAFADKDFILQAYQNAIEKKYRFFSFGDAMLIL